MDHFADRYFAPSFTNKTATTTMNRFILFATTMCAAALAFGQQQPRPTVPLKQQPDGMLVPMMSDDEMRAREASGQGELVFNKTMHGFYFFNGTDWEPLLTAKPGEHGSPMQWTVQKPGGSGGSLKLTTGTSGFWDLTGNAATDPATDFIGTTDNQPLLLRVNNTPAGKLSTTSLGMLSFGLNAGGSATGFANTFIGTNAGQSNTGTGNTFLGNRSGEANTIGGDNVFLGSVAGNANTEGFSNTFVGVGAGGSNETGGENAYFGHSAGTSHDEGTENVMLGHSAGAYGTDGGSNVYVGHSAGIQYNGSENVFLGHRAGGSNNFSLSGSGNVFLGSSSGVNNGSGSSNTLIGSHTEVLTGSLTNATAIGNQAAVSANDAMVLGSINGVNGATANTNVGIGTTTPADRLHVVGNLRMVDGNQAAGKVMTSDVNGTATWQALPAATADWARAGNAGTNPANDFLGTTDAQPLKLRVNNIPAGTLGNSATQTVGYGVSSGTGGTGVQNTFIGGSAGSGNTSGSGNTFLGFSSGLANTTGSNNTFLGERSGATNSSGVANTFIGERSGFANTTGFLNTFLGTNSGQNNTTAVSNTMVGNGAGALTTTGGSNTFLGSSSGSTNTTGTNNVFLGESAGSISTGSRNVFIGSSSGSANTTGSGNVAIGLEARPATGALSNAIAIGERAQVNTSNSMVLGSVSGTNGASTTVNVGIGTTSPADRLHVAGNIRMVDGNQASGKVMTSDANGTATWQAIPAASIDWGRTGNAGTNASTNFLGTTDAVDLRIRTNNLERLSVTSGGNVGIGTTAPADKLHVAGSIRMVDGSEAAGKVLTSDANGTGSWKDPSIDWTITGNAGTNASTHFIGTTDAVDFRIRTGNTERIAVTSAGRTGIGTNAPAVLLDVNGGFALREGSTVNVGPGTTTITVGDRSYIRAIAGVNSNAILSNGLRIGQLLYLQHLGGLTGIITIADNAATTNCNLVTNRSLGPQDTLTLIWDGNDWVEVAYADN
jgi:hypothetical protein